MGLERLSHRDRRLITFRSPRGRNLPVTHGLLRVTGVTLPGTRETDSFEVTTASSGDVDVVLIDVDAANPASANGAGPVLLDRATRGLSEGTPLQAIMLDLARALLPFPGAVLRATLMRSSPASARVEVTTAGMPPLVCIKGDGAVTLHSAASPALKASTTSPPPVEVVPLVWGSAWCLFSDGFTSGSLDAETTHCVARELALPEFARLLSDHSPSELAEALEQKLKSFEGLAFGPDRTFVLLQAGLAATRQSLT